MTCIYNPNTKRPTVKLVDENGEPIHLNIQDIDIQNVMKKVARGIR